MNSSKRYIIYTVPVDEEKQVVEINKRLPYLVETCTGISLSIKEYLNPEDSYFPEFGEISLQFNTGKQHPVHYYIPYSNQPEEQVCEFIRLNNPLQAGQFITGYYRDKGLSVHDGNFQKYTVMIYLECKLKTEKNVENSSK